MLGESNERKGYVTWFINELECDGIKHVAQKRKMENVTSRKTTFSYPL